ncbi:MAG: hypothetical protein WBR18_01530 [Anaerolineales bacterium]
MVDPKTDSLVGDHDGNGVVSPGDDLEYAMTISNVGGSTAENVVFSDSPDTHTSLIVGSVTTTQGTVVIGNTAGDSSVQVSLGDIPAGGSATITFQVTIDPDLPANITEVSNQGRVIGDNVDDHPTDDPDTPESDDPTDTPITRPTPAPSNTPSIPGEPQPTPVSTTTTEVLIPVTGVDLTGGGWAQQILLNIGLSLLGLGLVVHGLSLRAAKRRDADG